MRSAILLMLLLLGMSAWSQDQGASAGAPVADEAPTDAPAADEADPETPDDENSDDADLDEQSYERDDDVFVPTEEIPVDESIPFPTDI
ncbi:MAG TPA: hypothetical protein VF389_01715 [Woeseiaceae bacterium]